MRVAELDLDNCPTGLKSQLFNGTHACVVNEDAPGCTSVLYSSFSIQYSKICGKIRGYTFGTVTGLRDKQSSNITDNYLDGVSLTSNGNHIWSFVADGNCDCGNVPSFIGNDWTCDGAVCNERKFCDNLIWNTTSCGESSPWFLKNLSDSASADIEMRVCRDEHRHNEDIPISTIELFVQ